MRESGLNMGGSTSVQEAERARSRHACHDAVYHGAGHLGRRSRMPLHQSLRARTQSLLRRDVSAHFNLSLILFSFVHHAKF